MSERDISAFIGHVVMAMRFVARVCGEAVVV